MMFKHRGPKDPGKKNPFKKVAFVIGANDNGRAPGVRSFAPAPGNSAPITQGAERPPADNQNSPFVGKYLKK